MRLHIAFILSMATVCLAGAPHEYKDRLKYEDTGCLSKTQCKNPITGKCQRKPCPTLEDTALIATQSPSNEGVTAFDDKAIFEDTESPENWTVATSSESTSPTDAGMTTDEFSVPTDTESTDDFTVVSEAGTTDDFTETGETTETTTKSTSTSTVTAQPDTTKTSEPTTQSPTKTTSSASVLVAHAVTITFFVFYTLWK